MYKVINISHNPHYCAVLEDKVQAYTALQHLQGEVIPKVYGYYEVWKMLHLLTLEPIGDAIQNNIVISNTLHKKMKRALC